MKLKQYFLSTVTALCMTAAAVCPTNVNAAGKIREYKGTLPVDGEKFTAVSYTADDLDVMLPMWEETHGIDKSKVKYVNFQIGSGEACSAYDRYFLSGEDMDIFIADPDWAMKYLNDDTRTLPLTDLGFSDMEFSDQYTYSQALCRASRGKNAGKLTASMYNISAGAWCYRADLAEKYLGVTSPDEMQELVSDWEGFEDTADKVNSASKSKTAITASVAGMWQAYSCGNTMPFVMNNAPAFDSFHDRFLDMAKRMWDKGSVSHNSQWTGEWYMAGQSNDIMGYFLPTWGFGDAILGSAAGGQNGKTYGKWAVCQGPQAYYWGGSMICVSPKTDNADLAADFIDYFTLDKQGMRTYSDTRSTSFGEYYIPNSQSVMQDIINNEYNGLAVLGGQSALEALDANAKAINNNGLVSPYDAKIKSCFMDNVNEYCSGSIKSKSELESLFKQQAAAAMTDTFEETPLDEMIKGDANRDGKVNVRDAAYIANMLALGRSGVLTESADFNGDGKINVRDAAALANHLAKK